ncbi:MAG TPA: hypothetical protein VH107_12755 [Lacipirellulaceae bacterium]|nr:hypothetical protein [Lacipirellulaceae bacterium]
MLNLLICEQSGRWAAALRTAFGRSASVGRQIPGRIQEVRRLAEFVTPIIGAPTRLNFVEVQPQNLSAVLELLTQMSDQLTPIVALVDDSRSVDALYEAGATLVVETPRQIGTALKLATHFAGLPSSRAYPAPSSIADWAHAALPWQPA